MVSSVSASCFHRGKGEVDQKTNSRSTWLHWSFTAVCPFAHSAQLTAQEATSVPLQLQRETFSFEFSKFVSRALDRSFLFSSCLANVVSIVCNFSKFKSVESI